MKKNIIFFLIIFAPLQIKSKATVFLNLDQAIKIAYKNRPSLKALKFATQASKKEERIAISGYFPQISITSKEQFSSEAKSLQNGTTIQASQLIYSFGGPKQLRKIAKKGTDISKLTEERHKDLIRYEVETSFLQTWLLQEKKRVIKHLNISAKEIIKKSEHQENLKLLGKNDWLIDVSNYANKISNVYLYIDELSNSQNQLEYLLGDGYKQKGITPKLVWNIKQPIKIKSLIYYYNEALKNRQEIKLKQKKIEQYVEYQTYYKNNYLPEISLSAQTSRADQIRSNNLGINLNWKLYDGSYNYNEAQKANANKLKAFQEKETYIQQIKYEVQQAYHELIQYKKKLIAKNIELKQALNQFKLAKLKFKIGDISKVDMDIAKYNWENKRFSWLNTKISTVIQQRKLMFTCSYPKHI